MTDADLHASPRKLARLTGALYLYIMVAAMFAEAFVSGRLVVAGDAAATAHRIAASEGLWRWGVVANVTTTMCDIAVAVLLFFLLRPVSVIGAAAAAAFRLAFAAAMIADAALLEAPLLLRQPPDAPPTAPAESLMMFSLRLRDAGFEIALVAFGLHLLLIGLLVARSSFLPRMLGAALALAGICYVANSLIGVLMPAVASDLFPWLLLPGFVAEASLTLWLLIVGIDPQRWKRA